MSRSAVSGVVRAARPATEGVRGTVVVDGGGLVLTNIQLQLIFWGTHWVNASITDVTNAVRSILGSNYMSSLLQYRGAGGGQLLGTFSVTSGVGTSPADPPNPFTNNDVSTLIANLIHAGSVPAPTNQIVYMVMMPPGVASGQAGIIGEHTYFNFTGANAHYGWVMNDGTRDYVTTVFSHELVETCTDPEGTAIQLDSPPICTHNPNSWCEIGDVCNSTDVIGAMSVRVQSYWSQRDGKCVVPK